MQQLLGSQDQASHNGLKALDLKLTEEIKKMREQPKKTDSDAGKASLMNKLEARSSGARSHASRRSAEHQDAAKRGMQISKSSGFVKPQSPRLVDGVVKYEDPALKLCIDDDQWNSIVQQNKK